MIVPSAGIAALGVTFPRTIRTNAHWIDRHPEFTATLKNRRTNPARAKGPSIPAAASPFFEAMAPFAADPFRGAVERRVVGGQETALSLELTAARQTLEAADLRAGQVDGLIVCSFLPDQIGVGNAAFLARALEIEAPAWNFEAACSGGLLAFEAACRLVQSGAYERILVVTSCTYSRVVDDTDVLAPSVGDGAAAFVVAPVPAGEGLLSASTVNTSKTNEAMAYTLEAAAGQAQIRMRAGPSAAAAARDVSDNNLLRCANQALLKAGVSIDAIDFVATATPFAWYSSFCARLFGVPGEKVLDLYPLFANTGPVLTPANLYFGAATRRIRPGSLVLACSVGVVSNASAMVLRWGNTPLGPAPADLPAEFDQAQAQLSHRLPG